MRNSWTLLTVCLLVVAASPLAAQDSRARFDIDSVGDSTFTFARGRAHWVSRGQRGLAVDAKQGDALIARFRVLSVDKHTGVTTAVVTGQTARVTPGEVALLKEPKPPFYVEPFFWIALGVGGAIGFFAHTH
jgi:hypothetical protein